MKQYIIVCLALLCLSLRTFSQESQKKIEITGTVLDNNNEPLIGVNVTIKNMPGLGSITDINGKYRIKTEPYSHLIFSYVGFKTQEVLVKTKPPSISR